MTLRQLAQAIDRLPAYLLDDPAYFCQGLPGLANIPPVEVELTRSEEAEWDIAKGEKPVVKVGQAILKETKR